MIDTIEITKMEYYELRLAHETLRRLENAGVDNWIHYEFVINDDVDEDETTLEQFKETLKEEIYGH